MNKLNILNLATSDEGGAGIASRYYNDLFIKSGHNSRLLVKKSNSINDGVIVLQKRYKKTSLQYFLRKVIDFVDRKSLTYKLGSLDSKYHFFYSIESKQHITAKKILKKVDYNPDLIIIHWNSNFINSKTIKDLKNITNAKIFWIMMDNSPITGGCHYPWDCRNYEIDCSNCPALLDNRKKNIAHDNLKFKLENLPSNIELIAGSEFDYIRASKSQLFKNSKIHKIIFPLDENRFLPGNKNVAKEYFGITSSKRVIFIGSSSLSNVRKGNLYFFEALYLLQCKYLKEGKKIDELQVLLVGNESININGDLLIDIKKINYLSENDLIKAYQAADIFVSSSLEDSGPLMVNQAIMCGVPVVSFNIGVALDLVITNKTGYLAKLRDVEDMALGIERILDLDETHYKELSDNCREIGIANCLTQKKMSEIIAIYNT
jgi:glycosyltransferase involved in cell wall biosynthesis